MIPPTKAIIANAAPSDADDVPMTPQQTAELRVLCAETGAEFDTALTAAQAAERIAVLRKEG